MELIQVSAAGRQVIERYAASGFRVSGMIFAGAVLVFPDRTIIWERPAATIESLAAVAEHGDIELLLLGQGRRMSPAPAALRQALRARGVGLEAMDTGAACRTFNVLIAEDRRVAAALLPPV